MWIDPGENDACIGVPVVIAIASRADVRPEPPPERQSGAAPRLASTVSGETVRRPRDEARRVGGRSVFVFEPVRYAAPERMREARDS